LEKFGSSIATVVFAMDRAEDEELYARILPLYFPRSKQVRLRHVIYLL
jgi:hypothetical protein